MADVIKLNYPAMQDMAQDCLKVAERLEQTGQFVRQTAQQLEADAIMVGNAGTAFCDLLTHGLASNVQGLSERFREINKDILGAISDMQAQDQSAGGKFK